MSAVNSAVDASKASKKKKKNKKKANGQTDADGALHAPNGVPPPAPAGGDDEDEEEHLEAPKSQTPSKPSSPVKHADGPLVNGAKSSSKEETEVDEQEDDDDDDDSEYDNDRSRAAPPSKLSTGPTSDATARLDAMQQERDSLRAEVTQLRQSLESLQEKHDEDLSGVKEDLRQSELNKENAEMQYRNLRDKINTIRSQLGDRLKADAAELEQARERIDELERANRSTDEENERLQVSVSRLNNDIESQVATIENLRNRTNASTNNWARERDDLIRREAHVREEYEEARQAMQDWEILATEERSRREGLEDRVAELEDQLNGEREAYERMSGEAETQSTTVDGLQRALRDLQDERKRELREMVEQTQAQLEALRTQTQAAEDAATELRTELETSRKELERTAPFEKEVKEKNLLIGKLRHEAVILNDHLTKALRFLKRGKPEDNVDRQVVTNHLLHFLQLDRSDPKKFQVLQLIAALLGWDEQQREQAGLLRQGSGYANAGGSLRAPLSPFRRTPSTPSLTSDFNPISPSGEPGGRESLAELWSEFLERESESGSTASGHTGRPSMARSPSMASQGGIMSPSSEKGFLFGSRASPETQRKASTSTMTALGLGRHQ